MRQLIVDKNPDKKGLLVLIGKDFRYLRQVLRVKNGDMIYIRLPDGSLKNSTVAQIDDKAKKITLQLCADTVDSSLQNNQSITRGVQADSIEAEVAMNGIEYWLFQFLPRPQKLEQIVRQATECGVYKIIPVIGEYSEKSSIAAIQGSKSERLEKIIREARQQSGSPVCTTLAEPVTLEKALEMFWGTDTPNAEQGEAEGTIGFVLSERQDGDKPISQLLQEQKQKGGLKKICVACGSEGGISPEEIEILVKKGLFNPIHFSVNILRCETAALYGIAAVQTGV